MGVTGRAHVDHVDVGAIDDRAVIGGMLGNREALGGTAGELELRVGDRDQLAAIVAAESWQMGEGGPGAGAEDTDAKAAGRHEVGRS
jgi:hypothetical protein